MAFVLIAQQPLNFKGQHYEPGDRLIAEWYESAPLQRRRLTILAPSEEQRAQGQSLSATIGERLQGHDLNATVPQADPVSAPKRRGRPRKILAEPESRETE